MTNRHKHLWVLAIFCCIGLGIYHNSLNVPFYFDDINNIQNPAIQIDELSFDSIKKVLSSATLRTRPVSNLSFALNYYFNGERVQGYHLVNIIIHIVNAFFLYLLIKRTLSFPINIVRFKNIHTISFLAALLWLSHPLATQSVTYIVQRMNSLEGLFYLLSILCFLKGRDIQIKKHNKLDKEGVVWLFLALVSGIVAFGSKETAATLPLIIFLYEFYFYQNLNRDWLLKKGILIIAITAGSALALAYYRFGLTITWEMFSGTCAGRDFSAYERILTQSRVLVSYIASAVYPHPSRLSLEHDFLVSTSFVSPITTLYSSLFLVGAIVTALLIARRERLFSLCILWFFINLAIESSFICLELVFEHRTYVPLMFVALLFVGLLFRFLPYRLLPSIIVLSIIAIFAFWTYERNTVWEEPEKFWRDATEKAPLSERPKNYLARELMSKGEIIDAEKILLEAYVIDPTNEVTNNNLGALYQRTGRLDKAVDYYLKAIENKRDHLPALVNLGSLYQDMGDSDEAKVIYLEAIRFHPDSPVLNYNLGKILLQENRAKEAIYYLDKFLEYNQKNSIALHLKGQALAKLGDVDEAISTYMNVLLIDRDQVPTLYHLASLLDKIGKNEDALKYYKMIAMLANIDPPYQYDYANVLLKNGNLEEAKRYYLRFLEITPIIADALNNLGLALAQQESFEMALQYFQKALLINPSHELAAANYQLARDILTEGEAKDNAKK